MTPGQPSLTVWSDLPDPDDPATPHGELCQVLVSQNRWEHVRAGHLTNQEEPWTEAFPGDCYPDVTCPMPPVSPTPAGVQRALDWLGQELRAALQHPLALVYLSVPRRGAQWRSWQVILFCGAKAIVRLRRDQPPHLVTCFFPGTACRAHRPAQRWRHVVRSLVSRYGDYDPDRNQWIVSDLNRVFPRPSGPEAARCQVRFVTPRSWGFRADLQGNPWRGNPPPWPRSEDHPRRLPRRLAPRRRRWEEDDHV